MECPTCGALLPDGACLCGKCGNRIDSGSGLRELASLAELREKPGRRAEELNALFARRATHSMILGIISSTLMAIALTCFIIRVNRLAGRYDYNGSTRWLLLTLIVAIITGTVTGIIAVIKSTKRRILGQKEKARSLAGRILGLIGLIGSTIIMMVSASIW